MILGPTKCTKTLDKNVPSFQHVILKTNLEEENEGEPV